MKKFLFLLLFFLSGFSYSQTPTCGQLITRYCGFTEFSVSQCRYGHGGYFVNGEGWDSNCGTVGARGGACYSSCTCPHTSTLSFDPASNTSTCNCPSGNKFNYSTGLCEPYSDGSSSSVQSSSASGCPQGQISQGIINGQPICQGTCPSGLYFGSVNGVEGCYGTNNCPNGGAYGTVNGVSGCYGTQSNSSSGTTNSSVSNASTGSTNSSVSNTSSGSNNSTGSNTSSGSNNSSGSNTSQGSNSSAGAGQCDPTSNDYLDCLMPNINSEIPTGDFSQSQQQAAAELAATKAELQAKFNQIKNQFSQAFGATLTPAARQLDDICVEVKGQQACFGLSKWQSHLGIIGLVVMFVAAFVSLRIVLSR